MTRQSRPGRTCPPAADRPSRRRAAGRAARNPPRNRPRSRPAAQGSWAHICPRLPAPPVRARAAAGAVRRAEREQAGRGSWATTGGAEGVFGGRSGRRGGLLSCIGRRVKSGRRSRERERSGAAGAASCAAGGEGEDGAEGAAFCAVEAGEGAGATGVVLRETGGRTLVWSNPEDGSDRDEDDAREQSPQPARHGVPSASLGTVSEHTAA